MKRRIFIHQTTLLSVGSLFLPKIVNAGFSQKENEEVLKGFIVSDAHFGWDGKDQPTREAQTKAMKTITDRFPDLDLFIDTGDAHHNDHHNNIDPYAARKDWVDIIQGGCGQFPFYYVVGNHELRSNEDADPEMRSNILGSNTCRPYYSFDMKGIHFISFPELIRTNYITEEEWDWLELDLLVNRDKTIVMLSHNNIIGTTEGNAPGYRGIMDSEKMLQIFKENSNIISWMHGHNHNYEIVNHQNMLFVSNGRIGGFDPSRGEYGIGGIYFEISPTQFTVKCYSAEKNSFLEQYDTSLSQTLQVRTTCNPNDKFACSYGVGGATDGERIPAYHHHAAGNSNTELFLTGSSHPVINEDPAMTRYVERQASHGLDKILLAAKINHGNEAWEYLNPGIRLKANTNWWTTVTMPSDNYDRYSYYRCAPDTKYKLKINLNVKESTHPVLEFEGKKQREGQLKLWLRLHVHDIEGRKLRIVQSDAIPLEYGEQIHDCILEIPELKDYKTIYSNPESNNLVNMAIEASISGMNRADVEVYGIYLEPAGARNDTIDPGVIMDNQEYITKGLLKKGEIKKIQVRSPYSSRSVLEIVAKGNKRLTWLVRHSGLEWQVRNATIKYNDGYYQIDKIRNKLSDKYEIVIVPLQKKNIPYLHRIRKAEQIKFYPFNPTKKDLILSINKIYDGSEIDIYSPIKPQNIEDIDDWSYKDNIISARIMQTGKIRVQF